MILWLKYIACDRIENKNQELMRMGETFDVYTYWIYGI